MRKALKQQHKYTSRVLSFRVTAEIYEKIAQYGRSQHHDIGKPLNPPSATRRLVIKALSQFAEANSKKAG